MTPTPETSELINAQVDAADAFLQRFNQVCDITTRKLFPRLLAVLDASDVRHPFITVLDRLDGLGVIADPAWWVDLNAIRNRLIHEYAMSLEERASELSIAWVAALRLVEEIDTIRNRPNLITSMGEAR
ncbi:MAG: hypothetical protein JWO15_1327 [Sphingomonadales bacterium]|nr:hypothetical protein [Sphingomonadales bacterium]